MCRSRVRSVVDAATLRVAVFLIFVAAIAAANSGFSDDFNPVKKIFIIDPSLGIVPTSHGYHLAYGGPWVLVKQPPQKITGLTKQSSSQIPYRRFNAEDKAMSRNFSGYGRRSASEMSPAEEEYQAVRTALARDRLQPMRRSMVPTMGMVPKAENKWKDKTVEDLLPLTMKLASLIDKLDSMNDVVKNYGEDRMGKTKQSVILLLRDLISGLQKDVESRGKELQRVRVKKTKEKSMREYTRRGNVDDSLKFNHHLNSDASIRIDQLESGNKNKFSSVTKSLKSLQGSKEKQNLQSKSFTEVEKAYSAPSMTVLNIKSLNSTDKNGKPEFRTGLNDSEFSPRRLIDEAKMNEENAGKSVAHFSFDTSIGLVPEHRAFDNIAVEGQGFTEDVDTSIELVNRAFDDVTPSRNEKDGDLIDL